MPGQPVPTTPKGRRTLRALLDRAVAIASVEGLEALTIGRLAEDLHLSKSTVFVHFGSKEQLQLTVLEDAREVFVSCVTRPASAADPGLPHLVALLRLTFDYIERPILPGGCFMTGSIAEFDSRTGPVHDAVAEQFRHVRAQFTDAAEAAVELGALDPDTDPGQLAFELHAFTMAGNFDVQLSGAASARARRAAATRLRSAGADPGALAPLTAARTPSQTSPTPPTISRDREDTRQ
jgi:AcrR family transcriptional regulator